VGHNAVESWARVFSGIATIAVLVAGGAGLVVSHRDKEQTPENGNLLDWAWRVGVLVGVGALFLSVILRGLDIGSRSSSPGWSVLASVGDRAAVVALVAGILSVGSRWHSLLHRRQQPTGWVGLLLIAIVAAIGAFSWTVDSPSTLLHSGTLSQSAPFLLLCTLVAAGLALWAAGQELDAAATDEDAYRWALAVAFAGLTVTIVVVGDVNWRVWGTPGGLAVDTSSSQAGFAGLLAVWLISAAGLVLQRRAKRFVSVLGLLAAALMVGIALNVQWTLPFG
jgi:hypothetical protein